MLLKPKRKFEVTLTINCDEVDDIIDCLRELQTLLDKNREAIETESFSISGGYSQDWMLNIETPPNVARDKYTTDNVVEMK